METYESTTTEDFLKGISASVSESYEHIEEQYAIRLEEDLKHSVLAKDAVNAKKIMNQLLGHIFFETGSNLKKIKVRVLELIVILSRAAIEGGVDIDRMFALNLSKTFKEETGMSITAYINQVRIEKSKQLLADRSYSLVDISNIVGFDDQSYYTKVFKSITGMSPGKYRETHGKK